MVDIISDMYNIKARKQHICDFCGLPIVIGERYHKGIYKGDDIYTWKSHMSCDELAHTLNMYDGWDDGVTMNAFFEHVQEKFKDKYPEEYDDLEWDVILDRIKGDIL